MAILFGTTGDGTTLPVLVDQFGNLLAKGIPGDEGPPGPPGGAFALPPNPVDGDVLGWENGQLVWIGDTPLPVGTYGPFVYSDFEGTLTVPQDVSSLYNGQPLIQSDASGDAIAVTFTTNLISNVIDNGSTIDLIFPTDEGFDGFAVGDAVQGSWDQNQEWSDLVIGTLDTQFGNPSKEAPFQGIIGTGFSDGIRPLAGNYLTMDFGSTFPNALSVTITGFVSLNGTTYPGTNENLLINGLAIGPDEWANGGAGGNGQGTSTFTLSNGLTSLAWGYSAGSQQSGFVYLENIYIEINLLVNASVPDTNSTLITAIDESTCTITVNGGDWYGSNGSGDPNGQTLLTKIKEGAALVSSASGNVIVLQNNNNEWVDDLFVTLSV